METALQLLLALLLVAINAFFVAAEYAIIRVRRTRINELAEQAVFGAKVVQRLLTRLDTFLAATQLGVTMATLGLSLVGEPVMQRLVAPLFWAIHMQANHPFVVAFSTAIGFAIITFVEVIFGELLPKWSVIENADRAACVVAYPMEAFASLFSPVIWLLHACSGAFARVFGLNPRAVGAHEVAHSEDEIVAIVEKAQQQGTIGESEAEIVDNVFEFAHTTAREIMVPRVDIIFLSTTWSLAQNVSRALESGRTRFPASDSDVDHIIGMIHVKDLLALTNDPNAGLESIVRQMPVVPETKPIRDLLRELQSSHGHQAIVLDEHGGTAGLVTLEDILEELVGEIQDEYDEPEPIEQVSENEFLVSSSVPIDDLIEELKIQIENEDEFETIGGYVLHALRLPAKEGAQARLDGFDITVAQIHGRRIRRLRFVRHEVGGEAAAESS